MEHELVRRHHHRSLFETEPGEAGHVAAAVAERDLVLGPVGS
jgi:hypothetical protein